MAKSLDRFNHGEHNEKACDLIATSNAFPDWVITTAFYAALHFVSYKIFPFKHPPGSNSLTFNTIEDWQNFKNYASNKRHDLLSNLVATHCPSISADYDWLLSMSMTARYHEFQHDKLIAEKAIGLLKTIKKACMPPTATK